MEIPRSELADGPRDRVPKLRDDIIALVSHRCCVSTEAIDDTTTMFGDLGVDGDDACDFINDFAASFNVDMARLNFDEHFGPEGCSIVRVVEYVIDRFFVGKGVHEAAGVTPITIGDLVRAASDGVWEPAGPNRDSR